MNGKRVRFTKDIIVMATGDHPDLLVAKKGEEGVLVHSDNEHSFWKCCIAPDRDPDNLIGCHEDEFEVIKEESVNESA